jgi:hypothetical protein
MSELALRLVERKDSLRAAEGLIATLMEAAKTSSANAALNETLDEVGKEIARKSLVQQRARQRAKKRIAFAVVSSFLLAGAVVSFALIENIARLLPPAPQLTQTKDANSDREAVPPVGTERHFSREFVRYCEFQKERLRIIKQHVQWREDIEAYNTLANDYNSRCSNYLYRDEDLKVITQELGAEQQRLQAETERILASWPWRSAGDAQPSANGRAK